jgi:hypothetical protein
MESDTAANKSNEQFHSCGVWHLASYINHSCLSNARPSFIGDMMVVHATRDLAPNTEVTLWYKSPFTRESEGDTLDLGHWGFKCDCAMCREVQETDKTVMSKGTRLLADLRRLPKSSRETISSAGCSVLPLPNRSSSHIKLIEALVKRGKSHCD